MSSKDSSTINGTIQAPLVDTTVSESYHDVLQDSVDFYKKALAELASVFDLAKFQSSVPQEMTLQEKQDLFQFEYNHYPPHLAVVPSGDDKSALDIFNFSALLGTKTLFNDTIPHDIIGLAPGEMDHKTVDDLVKRNRRLRTTTNNLFTNRNIGDRDDWYTDAVFGQQQFTGPNPTTITLATPEWKQRFAQAAHNQGNRHLQELITSSNVDDFYVQDYSYFRSAIAVAPDAELRSGNRYCCASVALFHLEPSGKLHPVAIILDYKGSMDASVTIFNTRTRSTDSSVHEHSDWPWRYAKTCMQVSDWIRHEITIHLVNTHMIEEPVIVAAHRTLPPRHIAFLLLEPHWTTTLSLNALGRGVLVPNVITQIVGFAGDQGYTFMSHAYKTFDWTALYIPNDLRRRGFPLEDLDKPRYHNYGYARNIVRVWEILRKFVGTVLTQYYTGGDAQVTGDPYVQSFCAEMRSPSGAQMASFPQVRTLDELIDMITMCIHIASPQHTAVNYLQQYYQVFIPNKPSALYAPLPKSLHELQQYTEANLIKSLPVDAARDWLLMAQLPYLLSFRVAEDQNILAYAEEAERNKDSSIISKAGSVLRSDLEGLVGLVQKYSKELDDQKTPYTVLDPTVTASSILI